MNLTVFFRRWLANPAGAPGRGRFALHYSYCITLPLPRRWLRGVKPGRRSTFRRQRVALRSEPPVD